jgi:hypothetical protein
MQHIQSDPACALAAHWRVYVAEVLLPLVRRVSKLLEDHAAVAAMPPKEWMKKTYPHMPWDVYDGSMFGSNWLSYARQWAAVQQMWAEGDHSTARPYLLMPFGGLYGTMTWSAAAAQAKQRELIGMTADVGSAGRLSGVRQAGQAAMERRAVVAASSAET